MTADFRTSPRSFTADPQRSGELVARDDRLLFDRIRLGLRLIMAGIAVVFVGELVLNAGARPMVNVVQAVNFAAAAIVLRIVRDPRRRTFNLVVGFLAYIMTIVCTGAAGISAGDAMTPVVMFVGLSVVTATLVPWTPAWQVASVLLVIATAIWTVASVVPAPRLFWLQHVGSVAPTLVSTVFLCQALRRNRRALDAAEEERDWRERRLREANQRLEEEIRGHRKTEDALRFAMRELDHRVKNTLATVQSVAEQTLRSSRSLETFQDAFGGRIQAMAQIHTALAGHKWDGLTMAELIELVVGPYRHHADSISIECDATFVDAELVRVLGMTLHELATNAAKYGALSTKEGRVTISSRVEHNGGPPHLNIAWCEQHGPAVQEPAHRGFGMRLIEHALAYEIDGRAEVRFRSNGLRCDIRIPIGSESTA